VRRLFHKIAAAAVFLAAVGGAGGQEPATQPCTSPTARAVVEGAVAEALAVLASRELPAAERTARVFEIADRHIDYETIARLVLGTFWQQATVQQQAEFVREFRRHIQGVYAQTIDDHEDEQVVVTEDRQEPRGDWTVRAIIFSNVKADGKRKEIGRLAFRMRLIGRQWKAIDVTVEGISVLVLYRAQFQAVAAAGGMERVLQVLRARNAPLDRSAGGADAAR